VRDEVRARAAAGTGVIADEKLRLFWDNIPLWYNLGLFNYFEKAQAVVVAETYSAAWSLRLDPDEPLASLALKSLQSYPLVSCVSIEKRKEMVLRACREYAIDGVVFHRNKSCVPISLGQMDIRRALQSELDIPSVVIDADHMDARNFSTAQFQTRIDAFLEMLHAKKGSC
jgi:benzoyl-CoA reductase/2-hydroxyglutaryl-CoA dehydratase subunit BcrC/BadD/HgdB